MTCQEAFNNLVKDLTSRYGEGEARSIVRIVFEDVFRFYQKSDRLMTNTEEAQLEKISTRLLEGEPVQYILGEADFYGFKFKVNPQVLIPRQETEELVYWIKNTIEKEWPSKEMELLDIGTGSACIAISLGKLIPKLNISAMDVSAEALSVAKTNATQLAVPVTFIQSDILLDKQWMSFPSYDIIVSNPPYISYDEEAVMDSHVIEYEPNLALFVEDEDPLLFYKKIILFALQHLHPGGYLFFETSAFHADGIASFMEQKGFSSIEKQKDMNGNDRMVRGKLL